MSPGTSKAGTGNAGSAAGNDRKVRRAFHLKCRVSCPRGIGGRSPRIQSNPAACTPDLAFPQRPRLPGRRGKGSRSGFRPETLAVFQETGPYPCNEKMRQQIFIARRSRRACPADGESVPVPVSARKRSRRFRKPARSLRNEKMRQQIFIARHSGRVCLWFFCRKYGVNNGFNGTFIFD